ncbi:MAG: hypothetical protein WAQ25_03865 [Candidatus Saccharimonas sp.]
MNSIAAIYYFFSPYTGPEERKIATFFAKVREHTPKQKVTYELRQLVQQNAAAVNLWSEHRYKGYRYLKKSTRQTLYKNLALIEADFATFCTNNPYSINELATAQPQLASTLRLAAKAEQLLLIAQIMQYLAPERGLYHYQLSSSFGRLLKNPSQEKLIGDCNQIVTLYLYLYSRHFNVDDLQLRLLPEHVALHYNGIDIEATLGTFADYTTTKNARLVPVEEIVSINLLDVSDEQFTKRAIPARDFLQAARMASLISSEQALTTHNLDAAYRTAITDLQRRNQYATALQYAKQSRDHELISLVAHNGALHATEHHNFTAARKFAAHAPKKHELIITSYRAEGAYHFAAGRYQQAADAYQKAHDSAAVRSCYEALWAKEQAKLGNNLTTNTIKNHAQTITRMHNYAKKSGNKTLINHTDELKKHI